ncbi:UNVERIFIED_CONTAM: hypothetical protein FKN15_055085 [Acipenser sinensis]
MSYGRPSGATAVSWDGIWITRDASTPYPWFSDWKAIGLFFQFIVENALC